MEVIDHLVRCFHEYKLNTQNWGRTVSVFFSKEKGQDCLVRLWLESYGIIKVMVEVVFKLCSHLLFIFFAFHLLSTVVEWERFFKVNADNAMKIRFLILLFSIALGYLVSLFFIGIYDMSRAIFNGTL